MPAISRTTNPTRVKRLEKTRASVRILKGSGDGVPRTLVIDRLDLTKSGLAPDTQIACVVNAGLTAQYFELGSVARVDLREHALPELALGSGTIVRIIFYEAAAARIVASIDGIRPLSNEADSSSLVSIQPDSLDGPLWRLELGPPTGEENPLLLVEETLFGNAKAAAASPTFIAMVLPEVVRQIARRVIEEGADDCDDACWTSRWHRFLEALHPRGDIADNDSWIDGCVTAFCARGRVAALIEQAKISVGGAVE
jgi:hypothetical protein